MTKTELSKTVTPIVDYVADSVKSLGAWDEVAALDEIIDQLNSISETRLEALKDTKVECGQPHALTISGF